MYRLLTDSVNSVLKYVRECSEEQCRLPLMLTLVRERMALVTKELSLERMFLPDTLPPLIKDVYNLDYMFETQYTIRLYGRLLDQLFEAEQSILAKLEDQNAEAPASDL